jgi:hypothetical protein
MTQTFFRMVVDRVSNLKPGERHIVTPHLLEPPKAAAIAAYIEALTGFTQADRVLENIVGSSQTHRYRRIPEGIEYFRFYADLPSGVYGYASPDRLHYYYRRLDGLYALIGDVPLTYEQENRVTCALRGHQFGPAWKAPIVEPMAALDFDPEKMTVCNSTVRLVETTRCVRCFQFGPD